MPRQREDCGELREFEGYGAYGWWARGHLSQDDFHETIAAWEGGPLVCPPIHHEWWRCVPVGPDMPGVVCYHQAKPESRGAFRVTVAEW